MSGKYPGYLALTLCAALALFTPAYAADSGGGPGGGGKGGPGKRPNPIDFILKHASDLNLTEDQKTQLKALEDDFKKNPPPPPKDDQGNGNTEKKGRKPPADQNGGNGNGDKPAGQRPPPPGMEKVKDILTPDQMAKLKESHDAGGDHPKPPKPPKDN